mgnify:CR=1 FL=1
MTKFKALSAGGLFVLLLFLLGGAAFDVATYGDVSIAESRAAL